MSEAEIKKHILKRELQIKKTEHKIIQREIKYLDFKIRVLKYLIFPGTIFFFFFMAFALQAQHEINQARLEDITFRLDGGEE